MRIWFDGAAIVRDTIPPLPPGSLYATATGNMIHVMARNGYILIAADYTGIQRQDGTGFASATAAKAYLDGEFAKYAPPAAHTHPISDVTGLQAALDGKASTTHTHSIAQVTGLQGALDGKQAAGSYAPLSHVTDTTNPHAVTKAQVGLGNVDNTSDANKPVSTAAQTALNGKANTVHTHAIADVTGLQAALDGKLGSSVTPATTTRALDTTFQPSATKAVRVSYSIKTQVTNPLLVGTSTCTVRLLSDAASPPTTERARVEATSGVGVTVTIALTTSNTATLTYIVPAGHYVRLSSSVTGTGAAMIVSQVEETLG